MKPKTIKIIHEKVDALFERLKDRVLGVRLRDKQIAVTAEKPELTLAGLAVSAAAQEGARMSKQSLESMVHVAGSYIDSEKERAKALIVNAVDTADDPSAMLGGQLSAVWEKVTNNVTRIVDSEAQRARSLGGIEGITMLNLQAGVEDPVVFFVTVRDQHRCDECTRLHLLEDRMTPRVWKLSEVGTGYHKKGQPNPKACGLHPHCRCTPATLLPGWGFGPGGMVKFIAPGHDEYARQRGLQKAEVPSMEQVLAKIEARRAMAERLKKAAE